MENKSQDGKPVEPKKPVSTDTSIFHGKNEISRSEFRQELKKNYEGSQMNVYDRARIEKKDFPSFYGSKISKSDMRSAVSKLGQKLSSEKDPAERNKIRNEISYLKRIGNL